MTAGDDVGDIKVVDIIDDIIDDTCRACRNLTLTIERLPSWQ